jgi:NADH-quinone oxidoreductase subunit L
LLPYAPWLAWIVPFLGATLTLVFATTLSERSNHVAVASIGLSAVFSFSLIPAVLEGRVVDSRVQVLPFEISVLVDPLAAVMACVVSFLGLLVAIFSVGYMRGEASIARFWFLIQLFIGGYMVIVLSGDLLLTFMGWEVVGLSCMALAAFWYRDPAKARIGLKTGMLLRIGDIGLLASLLAIYASAGTLHILDLQQASGWLVQLSQSGLLLVTTGLFLVGVMGKAAQFPLQEWLPDMLVASPSCFNALTECLAGPFLLARLLPAFYQGYMAGVVELGAFFQGVVWIGVISALVTALLATAQTNVFKILAFSVSSVIGFMLAALGLAGLSTAFAPGYLAGTFLLTVDAFISGLLFLTAAYVAYRVGSDDIRDMAGVKSTLAHRGIEVGVFAMIGIPPLSGFWCANWIQAVAVDLAADAGAMGQHGVMVVGYLAFLLLLLTGVVTAFYGLRLMWTLGGTHEPGAEAEAKAKATRGVPRLMHGALLTLLLVTMLIDFTVPLLIPLFTRFFMPIVRVPFLENVFEVGWYLVPSLSTVLGLAALALGVYPAYRIYQSRTTIPETWLAKHPLLRRTQNMLVNQLYMDAVFRRIAGYTTAFSRVTHDHFERELTRFTSRIGGRVLSLARTSYKYLELEGISRWEIKGLNQGFDVMVQNGLALARWAYPRLELQRFEAFNDALPRGVARLVERVRDLHTGVLSYNMLAALGGIILMLVLVLLSGGLGGGVS